MEGCGGFPGDQGPTFGDEIFHDLGRVRTEVLNSGEMDRDRRDRRDFPRDRNVSGDKFTKVYKISRPIHDHRLLTKV